MNKCFAITAVTGHVLGRLSNSPDFTMKFDNHEITKPMADCGLAYDYGNRVISHRFVTESVNFPYELCVEINGKLGTILPERLLAVTGGGFNISGATNFLEDVLARGAPFLLYANRK
ncbi:MAG: hypothetical protein WCF85_18465 [Rhodospirillaceae bacterium]